MAANSSFRPVTQIDVFLLENPGENITMAIKNTKGGEI